MLKSKKKPKKANKDREVLSKKEREPINSVRKKVSDKLGKIKSQKLLPSELSNPVRNQRFLNGANGVKRTRVRVIGIGGGGGSIVSEIASQIKNASFVAANTDSQALKSINRNALRFQFGQNLTQGLGTGMNVELAETAAQNEKERIKKLLEGQDFCVLVASLGGGTGSGAAPIFAKIARSLGLITLGIFTLPFKFEGEKKMEIAKESLQKLRLNLNGLAVLPNERIFQIIDKATPLKDALSFINKNLTESLEGLIETIYLPGLINIDFADLKTILQGRGRFAYLNTVSVPETKGGMEAIKKVISSPLYPYSIRGARGVLFNVAGDKILSLADVSQVSKTISEIINPEAKIIFGICQNKKYQNEIRVCLLAAGCGAKVFSAEPKKRKKISKKKTVNKILTKPKKQLLPEAPPQPALRPALAGQTKKTKPYNKPLPAARVKPKRKKIKIQVKAKKEAPLTEKKEVRAPIPKEEKVELKIRKNALQIKKEVEEVEKELLAKEQIWETPAFLRKQQNKQL